MDDSRDGLSLGRLMIDPALPREHQVRLGEMGVQSDMVRDDLEPWAQRRTERRPKTAGESPRRARAREVRGVPPKGRSQQLGQSREP